MATKAKETCLIPGCTREAGSHGQCKSCQNATRNLIKRGKTTWEKMEKKGYAKPLKIVSRVKAALGMSQQRAPKRKAVKG